MLRSLIRALLAASAIAAGVAHAQDLLPTSPRGAVQLPAMRALPLPPAPASAPALPPSALPLPPNPATSMQPVARARRTGVPR